MRVTKEVVVWKNLKVLPQPKKLLHGIQTVSTLYVDLMMDSKIKVLLYYTNYSPNHDFDC
jgi:hypothetical protein